MARKEKSPRERAARALCSAAGLPENSVYQGAPMWSRFLRDVDIVLQAALDPQDYLRLARLDDLG